MSSVVLNPVVRMSWLCEHWDENYIDLAKAKIKETVSLFIRRYPESRSCSPLQDV